MIFDSTHSPTAAHLQQSLPSPLCRRCLPLAPPTRRRSAGVDLRAALCALAVFWSVRGSMGGSGANANVEQVRSRSSLGMGGYSGGGPGGGQRRRHGAALAWVRECPPGRWLGPAVVARMTGLGCTCAGVSAAGRVRRRRERQASAPRSRIIQGQTSRLKSA